LNDREHELNHCRDAQDTAWNIVFVYDYGILVSTMSFPKALGGLHGLIALRQQRSGYCQVLLRNILRIVLSLLSWPVLIFACFQKRRAGKNYGCCAVLLLFFDLAVQNEDT
jgi:hypothetical protein